jgi:hypothetical protein
VEQDTSITNGKNKEGIIDFKYSHHVTLSSIYGNLKTNSRISLHPQAGS